MRILILVHGYPPAHTGGAERRAARTAQNLSRRGWDVMVLAIDRLSGSVDDPPWTDAVEDGVRVRRLTLLADHSANAFHSSYNNAHTASATDQAIRDFSPDIVHLFSGYLMTASAPAVAIDHGLPVVVSLTDYWWFCHRVTLIRSDLQRCDGPSLAGCARCHAERRRRFRVPAKKATMLTEVFWNSADRHTYIGSRLGFAEQADRRTQLTSVLNACAALISPSQYLADFYANNGVRQELLRVWRQGVGVDACVVPEPRAGLRFGYLGQVKYHKGVDIILDAWRHLIGAGPRHLYIYGSASGEPEYGATIQDVVDGLPDVTWPGEFAGGEVWDILSSIDVLIVSSRWVENSPNSILEAQAMGVPVIAADLGAMPEMVRHGKNGLLFSESDAESLREQMQLLLDNPEILPAMRANPLPFKNVELEIDELCGLYADVLASQRSSSRLGA